MALVKAAKVFLILVFGSGKPDLKLNVGDLNGSNIDSKDAAHAEVQNKVGQWEDQTLIDACYTTNKLVFARNSEGDHEITCTIPHESNGGNKRRKKSKKTKKKKITKKRKTMKKKK